MKDIIVFAIGLVVSFGLAVICGKLILPLLIKLKIGQTVRYNGPKSHLVKNGTPTMGGFIFILPMLVLSVVGAFALGLRELIPLIATTVLFAAVGFIDDFLKVVKHNKDGFIWYQKFAALIVVSVAFALYIAYGTDVGRVVEIPFFGLSCSLNLSYLFVPFCAFLMVSESNAVNITDGLDGLCAGCTIFVMATLGIISYFKEKNIDIVFFSVISIGALMGFFLYNRHPARVFMGDTGSLALGAAMGAMVIYIKIPFIILLCGLLFVIEALSVIMQVSYFKLTHGKRIFKKAPIHHHFEECGWKETKVTAVFWAFVAICCGLSILCVLL